jgi:hypothetical protein
MARWRRENPAQARAAEERRSDERRVEERKARSYVSAYLRRGRIVPPPFCDRCGQQEKLTFYHPDPSDRRRLLWLCVSDRRAVPAGGFAVVPHWDWPGHIEPLPTAPRWERFVAEEPRVEAALHAARTVPDVSASQRREIFAAAFFRGSNPGERRALFGAGLGAMRKKTIAAWSPYADPRVDDELRAWITDEYRRWDRARVTNAPRFITDEDRIAELEIAPRFTARFRRRGASGVVDAIGYVPAPPAPRDLPVVPAQPLDDALLERVDADLAAFDRRLEAILARVAAGPPKRAEPTEEDAV